MANPVEQLSLKGGGMRMRVVDVTGIDWNLIGCWTIRSVLRCVEREINEGRAVAVVLVAADVF